MSDRATRRLPAYAAAEDGIDHPKQRSRVWRVRRWLREFLRHPLRLPLSETRVLYEDLLRHAAQTQALEDLLEEFPRRVCAALDLATFYIFIPARASADTTDRGGTVQAEYRLFDERRPAMSFKASSATVARMRRERKPSPFVPGAGPTEAQDAWQLLATPEEVANLEALGTQLLFPLEGRTRLIGFVSLSRAGRRGFTAEELRFLRDLGPRMGRGLETALLVRALSEQAVASDRAARELEFAREVQENLLPRLLPEIGGLDLAALYQTAEKVGGDYYDCFVTAAGLVCTVVADVSGKGVPAALLMGAVRASLHALMLQPGLTLAAVVGRLNELLYRASSSSRYATLFVCLYDPASRELEYVNAGHNPPLLLRAEGTVARLTEGGAVIGLLAEAEFASERLVLGQGDVLVAYTDGITEAVNRAGAEWTESGLEAAMRGAVADGGERTAAAVLEHVRGELAGFAEGADPVDDMTLFVMSRPG